MCVSDRRGGDKTGLAVCNVEKGTTPDRYPDRVMRESITTGKRKKSKHVENVMAVFGSQSYTGAGELAMALSSVCAALITGVTATYRDSFLYVYRLLRRPS